MFDDAQTGGVSRLHGLGIDVGTTNAKVAVLAVPDEGLPVQVLAVAAAPTPAPGDLDGTLRGLTARALAQAAARTGAPVVPAAVGVASMAETGVPLGADGGPLGGWLRWDGHRAAAEAAALADRLGATALFEATGVRPSAKVPLATLAWLGAHEPATRAALDRWAGVADLAVLGLTGELVTDHTLAGRSMAYRLPPAGEPLPDAFDADLLAEVGLRPGQLPRVAGPGAPPVALRSPAWVAAGLPAGTPVTVAGHDHAVGAWAAGVRGPGDVADSLGTAEAVLTVLGDDPPRRADVAAAGMSLVRTVRGRPALLAGSSSAGAMVRWWLEHEAPGWSADALFAAVARLPDEERPAGTLVLPYAAGRQTPAPDPDARPRVLHRGDHGTVALAAALVDGLALQARWMLDAQRDLAGPAHVPDRLVVLGGPAGRNTAWMRAKALLGPVPLRLVDCAEPVAAGAALLALHRAGLLDPDRPPVLPALPGLPDGTSVPDPAPGADRALARFVRAALDRPDPQEARP